MFVELCDKNRYTGVLGYALSEIVLKTELEKNYLYFFYFLF